MSSVSSQIKRAVYFWEDFQYKNLRESSVGRKGLSLFELKDMDIPIPEFFVVSSWVFDDIVSRSLQRDAVKLLDKGKNPEEDEVMNSISKTDFSSDVEDEILNAYTRISGFTDAWVSVRSSVVFPSSEEVSFSGVFSTELNVRGFKNVLDSIKRIYSSVYTDDVVAYAAKKGVNLADVRLSVVIQKMIQAEVSGVAFTVDPITQDPTKLSVEAVFGLGDTIALGELTPDTYLLSKKDLNVVEKHISPQEWMKVRTLGKGGVEKIKISSNWSHRQKLEDKYLKEISKIALIVESKARESQILEWVLAGGKVWVLQSKDLISKSTSSVVIDSKDYDTLGEVLRWLNEKFVGIGLIESKAVQQARKIVNGNRHDYDNTTEKLINIAKSKPVERPTVVTKSLDTDKGNFIASGIGASFGTVIGKVIVLDKDADIEVTKNDILVIKKYASEMESLIVKAGGVVMDTGGLTSDTSILCRELDIPAVVGTNVASSLLKNGDIIRIDGNTGTIYKESTPDIVKTFASSKVEVHPVVEAYQNEELVESPKLVEKEVEEDIVIPHDTTLSPCATKIFVYPNMGVKDLSKYVGDSHGVVYIDLDKIMLEDGRHMLAYVEDKKFVEYSKDISEKVCKYINLAQGNQVIISLGSSRVSEFRALTKGKQFENTELEDSAYGATRYINSKEYLNRVLKIVRRIRNVYKKRNVDLAIHSPMSGYLMREFKKSVSAVGLRRTTSFKIYAILDNPAEVIMADDILDSKIDGLILNMPRIVRVMQGFDMDNLNSRYDLGINSAFKIIDNVSTVTKSSDKHLIVVAENNTALIKYCVKSGVYGISVLPEDVNSTRKLVSQEEAKVILGA